MGSDRRTLIDVSARELVDLGFTQIASNSDDIDTGSGINYTVWEKDGERYYVRAKEYVYQELAPFGVKHVQKAMQNDAWLVIYFDDRQQFYVFDPSVVWQTGDRTQGRSKRTEQRTWVEVPLTEGILLSEYMKGKNPRGIAETDREGSNASLDDYL